MNDVLTRVTGKTSYDPSVRQWFERWLETEKGAISEGTLVRYKQIVKDFLACIGSVANLRLENITTEDVLKYRKQLEAGGRAPLTVNLTIKRVLKRAFKVAMDEASSQETRARRFGRFGTLAKSRRERSRRNRSPNS